MQPPDGRRPAAEGAADVFASSKVAEVLPTNKQGIPKTTGSKELAAAAAADPVTQKKLSSLPTNTTDVTHSEGGTGKITNRDRLPAECLNSSSSQNPSQEGWSHERRHRASLLRRPTIRPRKGPKGSLLSSSLLPMEQ